MLPKECHVNNAHDTLLLISSHVNSSAQLERVNSPLSGSNNTRFVIISLTLTVHYAENGSNIKHHTNSVKAGCV